MIDVEDELAKILRKEIDREIIWGMLTSTGWIRVIVNSPLSNEVQNEISFWLLENCSHQYKCADNDFIFENREEAAWFKLRWQK